MFLGEYDTVNGGEYSPPFFVSFSVFATLIDRNEVMQMQEFEAIFKRYSPIVFRYLLSLCGNETLAEELTSETFYRAYLHIGSFRGECKVETWLCQIAKNALAKELRRQSRFSHEPPDTLAAACCPFEAAANKEQLQHIQRHLQALPLPYREVFQLRIFGQLRFQQIADIYGKTESWAKVTFYRAKAQLLKKLEGKL